jgi:predicted DNA binding protein
MARRFATLRIWHQGCWLLELTSRHPEVTIRATSILAGPDHVETDALISAPDSPTLEGALADPALASLVHELVAKGPNWAQVWSSYPTAHSLAVVAREAGLHLVAPVLHQGGREYWPIVIDSSKLRTTVESLRKHAEVTVDRLADHYDYEGAPSGDSLADRLLEDLSPRQLEVLERALREGYYQWPRAKDGKELAAEMGLSAPTLLEHLRRAETTIMKGVIEEVQKARGKRSDRWP